MAAALNPSYKETQQKAIAFPVTCSFNIEEYTPKPLHQIILKLFKTCAFPSNYHIFER